MLVRYSRILMCGCVLGGLVLSGCEEEKQDEKTAAAFAAVAALRDVDMDSAPQAKKSADLGASKARANRPEVNEAMFDRLSTEVVPVDELTRYTNGEKRILRNSMFAHHGYKFKSADLQQYFAKFSWYEPRFADVTKKLSSVENKNIALLKALEDSPSGEVIVDDRDGKVYKTVVMGERMWMAENLNYKINGSWCPDDAPKNCNKYGRLYTKSAAKKACPAGWHWSTVREWEELVTFVKSNKGKSDFDATLLPKNFDGTYYGGSKGVDKFGFKAEPAGCGPRGNGMGSVGMGAVYRQSPTGIFCLGYCDLGIGDEDDPEIDSWGFSVRCVKD